MRRAPVVDKFVTPITTATSLFALDKNLSQIFKQQQRQKLHKIIQVPPSYTTRQRDGITLTQRATFINAYKVLHLSLLPRDCISDIEQNYLDTKQSIQVRTSS